MLRPSYFLLRRCKPGLTALCLLSATGAVAAPASNEAAITAALRANARPAAMLMRQSPSDTAPAGSWLGGLPRMPADLAWPIYAPSDGRQRSEIMNFVAQIDLSGLPARVRSGQGAALPSKGVLWIFAVLDDSIETPEKVRVLYRPAADPAWPVRPAPSGMPEISGSAPYSWLTAGNPLAAIDPRQPLRMAALDTFAESPEGLPARLQEDDAFFDVLDKLRQAANRRAIGPQPEAPAAASSPYGPFDAWPQTGLFAELAAGLLLDALPDKYDTRDWPPAAAETIAVLMAEAKARQQAGAARPFEPLAVNERQAFRDWLASFDQRLRAVSYAPGKYWRPYPDTTPSAVHSETYAFAADHVRAHGGAGAASLPASRRAMAPIWTYASDEQILGHGKSWQNAPYEHRNDVLLLQLGNGHSEWLPVGVFLHLWISPADLAARQFDRVQPTLESD